MLAVEIVLTTEIAHSLLQTLLLDILSLLLASSWGMMFPQTYHFISAEGKPEFAGA